MKKVLYSFLCIASILLALLGNNVENYYADTGVTLSVSASTVKVGDEVSVTISIPNDYSATIDFVFPKDLLSYEGASISANNIGTTQLSNGRININLSDILNLTSVTLKFKATLEGTANIVAEVIKAGNNITEETVNWDNVSKNIVVEKPAPPVSETPEPPKKSDDNSLVSLKLSAGALSPAFKGNVTKYTATVGYDVTKVVVSAKTSSSKATIESVTGNGTVNLNVGENVIKIVVKAENGVSATYTITVTRKEQESEAPQPSESESTTQPEKNEALQWNGEQLFPISKIPTETIPTAFESKLLVVNGQQMQGLSFTKADLTVLYLNNTNGAGSLYVYDKEKNTIYPFIKLDSEKSFVMVLLPDEKNDPVPEGFESCTLSIEGKGVVNAYQLTEKTAKARAKESEFYLIYCMNNNGQKGWYMYDSVEETFQRYFPTAVSAPVGGGESSGNIELQDEYENVLKELNAAKTTQYMIGAIAAAIIVILIIIIIILFAKVRSGEPFFDKDDEDDEDDTLDAADEYQALVETKEENTEEITETEEVSVIAEVSEVEELPEIAEVSEIEELPEIAEVSEIEELPEIAEVSEIEEVVEEDDEIEIEFYHIEEEEKSSEEEEDSDLEFIDFD